MKKDPQRLSRLLDGYFNGTCSKEELDELFARVRVGNEDEAILDRLRQEWDHAGTGEPRPEPDWGRMLHGITSDPDYRRRQTRSTWRWAAAVAAILVLFGSGSYFVHQQFFPGHRQQPLAVASVQHIVPGGNKAVLTLADGATIILDSAANGLLARQGNTAIQKTGDGILSYTTRTEDRDRTPAAMNTIRTPRGGQYQITLPDGTRVWLNAESSLKFPASFAGNERRVELSGEAYFEVARNEAMPFLVSSGRQTVRVLGTRFNINAYQNERVIKTTLLEGSVEVTGTLSGARRVLAPGQLATTAGTGEITIEEGYPEQAIAWKNGKFMFNRENIESIMRRIARWYDAEIVYLADMKNIYFTGSVSRFAEVTDVLRKLELTGSVHFKIEERRIIVMP